MGRTYSQSVIRQQLSEELLQSLTGYIHNNYTGDISHIPVMEELISYSIEELDIAEADTSILPVKNSCEHITEDASSSKIKIRYSQKADISLDRIESRKRTLPMLSLETAVAHLEDSFQKRLLYLIDGSGLTDAEVYKRAVVTRQNFSKIRNNEKYMPQKNTAIRFAIALQLNLDQTNDLLRRAGYTLSPANRADVIIQYFIERADYDIDLINMALYKMDEQTLF